MLWLMSDESALALALALALTLAQLLGGSSDEMPGLSLDVLADIPKVMGGVN